MRRVIRQSIRPVAAILVGGLFGWLLRGATVFAQPPNDMMEATLTSDQSVYTNTAGYASCPACTTNVPPCELPCYLIPGTNATAAFTFQVTNASARPETFVFPTSREFDVQLIDTTGAVVAAWSDGLTLA